jgi:hypothetical protein
LALGADDDLGTQPLQYRQPWDYDQSPPQFVYFSSDQDETTIGLQSRWHQPCCKRTILPNAKGLQPIVSLQLGQVFSACLIAFGIAGPRSGRDIELPRQEVQKFRWRRFIRLQRASRIPQESELNGKTQTILGSSPATDQAQILIAEDVMLDQSGAINWDRFKSFTL